MADGVASVTCSASAAISTAAIPLSVPSVAPDPVGYGYVSGERYIFRRHTGTDPLPKLLIGPARIGGTIRSTVSSRPGTPSCLRCQCSFGHPARPASSGPHDPRFPEPAEPGQRIEVRRRPRRVGIGCILDRISWADDHLSGPYGVRRGSGRQPGAGERTHAEALEYHGIRHRHREHSIPLAATHAQLTPSTAPHSPHSRAVGRTSTARGSAG